MCKFDEYTIFRYSKYFERMSFEENIAFSNAIQFKDVKSIGVFRIRSDSP